MNVRRYCIVAKKLCRRADIWLCLAAIVGSLGGCSTSDSTIRSTARFIDSLPRISPDYSGLLVPPNIGPLNFIVRQYGAEYFVELKAEGESIKARSFDGRILLPPGRWKRFLEHARGKKISYDIFVKRHEGNWSKYRTYYNYVSIDSIDKNIVFRVLPVICNHSSQTSIMQHDLETNRESTVFAFKSSSPGCVNCHTFFKGNPHTFFLQSRHFEYGKATVLVMNDAPEPIDVKFGYGTWHPGGKIAAFTINRVAQCFHSARPELREHFEYGAYLVNYHLQDRRIEKITPAADSACIVTWPCWSSDGKFLYYSSSPRPWNNDSEYPPQNLDKTKFSILRIPYDESRDTWGAVDTIVSSRITGKNAAMPRCSPDGRFLVFCMSDWGTTPLFGQSSDLHIMDLATRRSEKLSVSSDFPESWHTWSQNGRWLAFSSKRCGGTFTRIYICHIDTNGACGKQFVLPNTDPGWYDSFVNVCNTPEFTIGTVSVGKGRLFDAMVSKMRFKPVMATQNDETKEREKNTQSNQYIRPTE